jgi:putative nucleotidyltransferase with HDIG domain
MSDFTYAAAERLLHEWVQSESLRKHCLAVAASMRHFARRAGADEELWATAGLLHDFDYERYPSLDDHPYVGVAYLREQGWPEEICGAILSHADYSGEPRDTPMRKALYAVDELSGFVTAVALVKPSRSVHEVDVRSVQKKLKDKAFARAVHREDIFRGAEELGLPVEALIAEVVSALQAEAEALGLAGTHSVL